MSQVSVVIPTYNAENFLERTIESVIHQTYSDWELLIVDDKSTDKTRDIIKRYENYDSRIRGIFLDKNSGGPAYPKNIGVKNSNGRYIAFLDHDDVWLPEKLAKQVLLLEHTPNRCTVLVTGDFYIQSVGCKHLVHISEKSINLLECVMNYNYIHTCSSILCKRELFDYVGFFDEALQQGDDWDFYIRILAGGHHMESVNVPVCVWTTQKGSISGTLSYTRRAVELQYILAKHKGIFLKHPHIYSAKLRNVGTLCVLAQDYVKGRRYFVLSICSNPISVRSYVLLGMTFFMGWAFPTLIMLKRKICQK